MLKKFLIWTYRTDLRTRWINKYQWWYLAVGFMFFLPLAINKYGNYWAIPESVFIDTIYWLSLLFINLNSLYLLIDVKYGRKVITNYYDNLLRYDKVVCCWEDEDLEKGKTYIIEDLLFDNPLFNKTLKGTYFPFSSFNYRVCKLVSLKEQRRLKLEQLNN